MNNNTTLGPPVTEAIWESVIIRDSVFETMLNAIRSPLRNEIRIPVRDSVPNPINIII